MSQSFQPKQIIKYEASHMIELTGNVSGTVINFALDLIPPIKESSVVHDNACGPGAVSECIMATRTPPFEGIHIDATDFNPQFLAGCAQLAEKNGWPLKAQVMDSMDLKFPDNRFTHSITSFALHCMEDSVKITSEIHRTLQPGGTAMASIWSDMPHVDAIKHAHGRTRGKDAPLPVLLEEEDYLQEDLKKSLVAGGFDPAKIAFYEKEAYVIVPGLKRWALLAWSYLGVPPAGWSQKDEERWDEAIEDLAEQLKNARGISTNEKGEYVMRMVACIAIATK
ncbi:Ubiquinone menaquinone biosynthesis C-methyltransferase [Fusarium albosuccineum]|uniref:Ubiquinone menaquinone biosynthesis C-methyltransferase n=1 Tax=Fusarium albosuccineum TaxID=1237068 RepID=A0A8H4P441_9HYPO|nr:Ubiquinone menaquinone biosynthesis C-methyltransferase [Fusarium albosuccineum]